MLLVAPVAVFAAPTRDSGVESSTAGTNSGGSSSSTNSKSDSCANSGTCSDCNGTNPPKNCVGCRNGLCQDQAANPDTRCDKNSCDFIKKYINPAINLLSVMFGIIAAASLIMGGIQYATSEGDPQKVAKAKSRLVSTIIAILAYLFLFSFLQFLIPGGIFNRT